MTNGGVDQVRGKHKLHAVGWLLPLANKLSPEPRTVPCWRHTPLWKSWSQELLLCVHDFPRSKCECISFNLLIPHALASSAGGLSEPLMWHQNCGPKVEGHCTWCIISKPHLFDVRANYFPLLYVSNPRWESGRCPLPAALGQSAPLGWSASNLGMPERWNSESIRSN